MFHQLVKDDLAIYGNIQKIPTGQGDNHTFSCLLYYNYFESFYKMIAIDISKHLALNADPKTIQQINLTAISYRAEKTTMFFIIEELKRFEIFNRELWECCNFIYF